VPTVREARALGPLAGALEQVAVVQQQGDGRVQRLCLGLAGLGLARAGSPLSCRQAARRPGAHMHCCHQRGRPRR